MTPPLILNVRGGGGSGKTTLMKRLQERFGRRHDVFEPGRKAPIAHTFEKVKVAVIGHYLSACGGCDNVSPTLKVFALIRDFHERGYHVLYEGRLLSVDVQHVLGLAVDYPGRVVVVTLSTPIEDCLEGINARRREKNPEAEDVNPENTVGNFKGMRSATRRLLEHGVPLRELDRETAFTEILDLLGIHHLPIPSASSHDSLLD